MASVLDRTITVRRLAEIFLGVTFIIAASTAVFTTFDHEEVTLGDGNTYDCGSPGDSRDWAAIRVAEERAGVETVDAQVADRCESSLDDTRSTRTAALAWAAGSAALLALSFAGRSRAARRELRRRIGFVSDPERRDLAFAIVRTIDTERLVIRRPRPEDAAAVRAVIDRGVTEAMGWSPEHVDQLVRGVERDETTTDRLICDRATGKVLGSIDVGRLDLANDRCEVGFWLGPGARGWGYGTEALTAVLAVLHAAGILAVDVMTAPDNQAVIRIMQKVGAVEMARGRHILPNGREVDAVWFLHRTPRAASGSAAR